MRRIIHFWKTHSEQRPILVYCVGAVLVLFGQSILIFQLNNAGLDLVWGDAYFVTTYPAILRSLIIAFLFFAFVSFLISKTAGRGLNNTLAYLHCWITLAGLFIWLWPRPVTGMAGLPRHYSDHLTFSTFERFLALQKGLRIIILTVIGAQMLFVANIVYALFPKRQVKQLK